jgi:hypothetical protein
MAHTVQLAAIMDVCPGENLLVGTNFVSRIALASNFAWSRLPLEGNCVLQDWLRQPARSLDFDCEFALSSVEITKMLNKIRGTLTVLQC